MTLLRNGEWSDNDAWRLASNDVPLDHADGSHLIALDQFQQMDSMEQSRRSGIMLNPEDDVYALQDHLQSIQLVAINFPKYTDGRGYSQARILRTQLHFSGEIRALGDVRPDQLLFMMRAGITSFQFEAAPNKQTIQQILTRFKANYQPSYALPIAG